MLTLNYKTLRSTPFLGALAKLGRHTKFKHTNAAYHVAKVYKALNEEIRIAEEIWEKLVKQYCELDERGEIKPHDEKPGTFKIDESKAEGWKVALKEFEEKTIEIDQKPIQYSNITDINLAPVEMIALEDVVKFEDVKP